ncbi:MAG: threonine/serine exporter ThrE family protein [Lachnospiraceae bacterium]
MDQNQKKVLEVAVNAGKILLENGAEIFRVEETISRIARAYQVETEESFVLSNGFFTTAYDGDGNFFAKVKHIPVSAARLNRVAAVNQLSREIEEKHYSIEEVEAALEEIKKMPGKTKRAQIFSSGLGSACFCFLFGGNFEDSAIAFIVGLLLYCYVLGISRKYLSKIIANISGGALVTMLAILFYHLHLGDHLDQVVIGSIIPLVPGLSFTNSIRDIADGDYISGSVRMLDALLVSICIAVGVGAVFTIYHRITGGAVI